ncbi:polysaccharide export protein [Vibrio crassostreae]|uniref:polysaccharide export protein n=1 Tax=Vibrio crassostreae TaxID=246167 RepID=UPI000F4A2965|nr:polysaccharide export protein [Vibrio crassostreae]ROS65593.1 polysaccharide export outer membrane protein [Vibrio crassostreae]RPF12614.1 polysaccharide export outer membrane protein [Vibrio crassostreae]TCT39771.1 polysaccharide export outer membrane protein [Vibrio crassostreae]TCV60195.1 polysaccharide export outer membrane protein [Vibrio crassostreae]
MKINKNRLLFALIPALLVGCTTPGTHLSTGGKNVIQPSEEQQESDISEVVNVYPLTAQLVSTYQTNTLSVSQANPELDVDIAKYEYKVGVGDILNITIWDHPELTIPAGSYRSSTEAGNWVHADGTIFYPYIGTVEVAGKTVREIRSDIAARLAKYIESPQVDVNVAAFRSKKTYITGEVSKPGQQPITNIPLTLLDAVNRSGGLSEDADWRNVSLTRNGVEENLSLYGLMQRGDLTQNRLLQAGDIVHVPRNDNQKVFVLGEVKEPKLLKIDRVGMSLTEALSNVGGINELTADATGVFVIRTSDDKSERMADIYQLDIEDASALVIGTEFDLKPYDIVYVTAAPISRWNRVVGQLLPTISGFNSLTEGALRVRNWP